MKRIVILFDCKYKQLVRAFLVSNRVQYSTSIDPYTGDFRVSVPRAKVAAFTSDMRRCSIPYMFDC